MPGSKWIEQITSLQREDGSWGCFHTLSKPTKAQPITTEQALRRLHVLGLGKDDAPVQKALDYMRDCLTGKTQPPDGREKVLNWDAFEAHMLGWSDIDIVVLTEREIAEHQANTLVGLRQALLERYPGNPYFRLFEGGMLSADAFLRGENE